MSLNSHNKEALTLSHTSLEHHDGTKQQKMYGVKKSMKKSVPLDFS